MNYTYCGLLVIELDHSLGCFTSIIFNAVPRVYATYHSREVDDSWSDNLPSSPNCFTDQSVTPSRALKALQDIGSPCCAAFRPTSQGSSANWGSFEQGTLFEFVSITWIPMIDFFHVLSYPSHVQDTIIWRRIFLIQSNLGKGLAARKGPATGLRHHAFSWKDGMIQFLLYQDQPFITSSTCSQI